MVYARNHTRTAGLIALLLAAAASVMPARAGDATPAKQLFGAVTLPSDTASQVVGFYSKGCLSGGMAIPTDGPTWQAMRLSRNRRWGHPQLIETIEKLSRDAASKDGWHGLLIGDMSQPRGGPMISGHASHQVGLDADIWLTQMPSRRFSADERETVSAISVLKPNSVEIDPKVWTNSHARLIMRAASYPEVQRILVHPAIKKQLCETWKGDRSYLNKVRPYYGHYYHMHVRIRCPGDSPACKAQNAVPADDGCGAPLKWWFDVALKPKKPEKPSTKPAKPKYTMLSDLPAACRTVLNAPGVSSVTAATKELTGVAATAYAPVEPSYTPFSLPAMIPLPKPRPVMQ